MSFGTSAGDAILLVQLAWKTLQGARQACGEHDELTREVASLHKVLLRLQQEYENPDSLFARADDDRRQEIGELCSGCEHVLNVMDSIITKYNALPEGKRSGSRLWQKVRFGNGEMQDLSQIRLKLSAHTSAILLSVNLCSLGSQGRVEQRLNDVGGDLEGIRGKVNWIAANMSARSGEGSVWSSYTNDDKGFWRELRRGLVQEGYRSSVLHKHKHLIQRYVEELGTRGVFDETDETETPHDVEGEKSSLVDNFNSDDDEENAQSDNPKLKEQSPTSKPREDERMKQGDSQKPTLNLPGKAKPELFALGDDLGSTDSLPDDAEVLNSRLSPPQSPKTTMYPRLDEQIHVGVLDPRAKKVRTPEEQEAHDKRKEARKARTSEQQAAHEKRKEEWRGKGKETVVHTAHHSGLDDRSVSELSHDKHVQMEEITDEEFSPTSRGENVDESGSGLDIQTHIGHSKKDPQSSTADSTNSEYSDQPKGTTDLTTQLTDDQVETKSGIQVEKSVDDEHNDNLLPLPPRSEIITLKDAVGRKFTFPLHRVKTWKEVKYALDLVFEHVDGFQYEVREGRYDLVGPNMEIILPQTWEDLIQPDWHISMIMFPKIENTTEVRKQHPPLTRIDLDEDDEKFESDNQVIRFKDAVGRKFQFPFYKVRAWKGIKGFINEAFMFVEFIGPLVEKGYYDLIGPDGTVIIPEFWKELIQPGWSISMHMWPIKELMPPVENAKKSNLLGVQVRNTPGSDYRHRRGTSSFPHRIRPRGRPPGPGPSLVSTSDPASLQERASPGPSANLFAAQSASNRAIPSSSSQGRLEIAVNTAVENEKKKRARPKQPGILNWMLGMPKKETSSKSYKLDSG